MSVKQNIAYQSRNEFRELGLVTILLTLLVLSLI